MTRKTMLTSTLIDEICDLVSRGACDVTVCRIIGIHRSTLWDWKRRGQREGDNPIFVEFWAAYHCACGLRELTWVEAVIAAKDYKFLLTHHPDCKEDFATATTRRTESTVTVKPTSSAEYIRAIDNYRKTLKEPENQS